MSHSCLRTFQSRQEFSTHTVTIISTDCSIPAKEAHLFAEFREKVRNYLTANENIKTMRLLEPIQPIKRSFLLRKCPHDHTGDITTHNSLVSVKNNII